MSAPAITIDVNSSMQDALTLMKTHKISMLPVMDGTRLVGVVTDSDLKRVSPSGATSLEIHEILYLLSSIRIKDIMTRNAITASADFTIEETAELLMDKRISGVPVVDAQGGVIGVISHTDLFRVIISMTGVRKKGVQFAFRLEDRGGSILEVVSVIRASGGRLRSILASYENVPEGYRNVYIRVFRTDNLNFEALKNALKEKFIMLYMVDNDNNVREIYQ
jgi:acetoin utilization protein AcuB